MSESPSRVRNAALIFLCVLTVAGISQVTHVGIPAISPVISVSASEENSSTENSSLDNFDMENSSPDNSSIESGIGDEVTPEETITPGETQEVANATDITGTGEPIGNESSLDLTNTTENSSAIPGNETGLVPGGGGGYSSGSGSTTLTGENRSTVSPPLEVTTAQETPETETTVDVSVTTADTAEEQASSNPILAFFADIFKGFRYITGMY